MPGATTWTRPLLNRDWQVRARSSDVHASALLLTGRYGAGRVADFCRSGRAGANRPRRSEFLDPRAALAGRTGCRAAHASRQSGHADRPAHRRGPGPPDACRDRGQPHDRSPACDRPRASRHLGASLPGRRCTGSDNPGELHGGSSAPPPPHRCCRVSGAGVRGQVRRACRGVVSKRSGSAGRGSAAGGLAAGGESLRFNRRSGRAPLPLQGAGARDSLLRQPDGAPVGAYSYAPDTDANAVVQISNGARNLAPMAAVRDETTPDNPSLAALTDGFTESSKVPRAIIAYGSWRGKADQENALELYLPRSRDAHQPGGVGQPGLREGQPRAQPGRAGPRMRRQGDSARG